MRVEPRTFAFAAVAHHRQRIFQRTSNAELMIATLFRYRDQGKFQLHGFVVMPDHIHVLFTTNESIGAIAKLTRGGLSSQSATNTKAMYGRTATTNIESATLKASATNSSTSPTIHLAATTSNTPASTHSSPTASIPLPCI